MSSSDDFDDNDFDDSTSNEAVQQVSSAQKKQTGATDQFCSEQCSRYAARLKLSNSRVFTQPIFDYKKKITNMIVREEMTAVNQQSVQCGTQTYLSSLCRDQQVQVPSCDGVRGLNLLLAINNIQAVQRDVCQPQAGEGAAPSIEQTLEIEFKGYARTVTKKHSTNAGSAWLVHLQEERTRKPNYNTQFVFKPQQQQVHYSGGSFNAVILHNRFKTVSVRGDDFTVINNSIYIVHQQQVSCYDLSSSGIVLQHISERLQNCQQLQQIVSNSSRLLCLDSAQNLFQLNSDLREYEIVGGNGAKKLFGVTGYFIICYTDGVQFIEQANEVKAKRLHIEGNRSSDIVEIIRTGELLVVSYNDGSEEHWRGAGDSCVVVGR